MSNWISDFFTIYLTDSTNLLTIAITFLVTLALSRGWSWFSMRKERKRSEEKSESTISLGSISLKDEALLRDDLPSSYIDVDDADETGAVESSRGSRSSREKPAWKKPPEPRRGRPEEFFPREESFKWGPGGEADDEDLDWDSLEVESPGKEMPKASGEPPPKEAMKEDDFDLGDVAETGLAKFEMPTGMEARASESPAEPQQESVEFAAFAPGAVTPKSEFVLDIWAFFASDYSLVSNKARETGKDATIGGKSGVLITRGSILTIQVEISSLFVRYPVDSLAWNGDPANTSYIVEVPENARLGGHAGIANVSHGGGKTFRISFQINVAQASIPEYKDSTSENIPIKTAFASYASENFKEVLFRLQGMKKISPDLDVFTDVFSLRSGDNWPEKLAEHVPSKDRFYLFWSKDASESEWVEREWKLALEKRGLNYIDPVPLVDPRVVPPPKALSDLHFGDMYIYFLKNNTVICKNRS